MNCSAAEFFTLRPPPPSYLINQKACLTKSVTILLTISSISMAKPNTSSTNLFVAKFIS